MVKESYIGKFKQKNEVSFSLEDMPEEDIKKVMENLPVDNSLPPDAFELSQNDIRRELVDRGIQPKGFFNDDANRLQEEYKKEHMDAQEARKATIIKQAAYDYMHNKDKFRKREEQSEILEEIEEVAANVKLQRWIGFVQSNNTSESIKLSLSPIGVRVVCKAMMSNKTLRSLDLSRNKLGDMAGLHLANFLSKNSSLVELDIGSNTLGPSSLERLAFSLEKNFALRSINLNDNPLTGSENNFSGLTAFRKTLGGNSTMTTINLWHTGLGKDGGCILADGMAKNSSIISLDFGNNDLLPGDELRIVNKLKENQARYTSAEQKKMEIQRIQREAYAKLQEEKLKIEKEEEHKQWIESRRKARIEQRKIEEDERVRKLEEKVEQLRLAQEKEAIDLQLKAEADKKKKRGKKKGGK